MSEPNLKYLIHVLLKNEESVPYSGPVEEGERDYFLHHILPNLRPLSDDEYRNGPAVILQTLARSSYILYQACVYWCVEWNPGLLVVKFAPDGSMAWAGFRSPNPEFGGREATEDELDAFDEDEDDYQYNLVFRAWDAQFEEFYRTHRHFEPADAATMQEYNAALRHVHELGESLASMPDTEREAWRERGLSNLTAWIGDGIRVQE